MSSPNARIAYRVVGPEEAPVIAVLGGISAHRMCAVRTAGGRTWRARGTAVDTRKFRVLGIDYLGGRGESSAPAAERQIPAAELLRSGARRCATSFSIWV